VNDLPALPKSLLAIKAGWLHTFFSFLLRPESCNRQFTPNGNIFAYHFTAAEDTEKKMVTMKKDLIDILTLLDTWLIERV